MAKVSKMVLSFPHYPTNAPGRSYKVVRVQHTTEFNPGDYLSKAQVDELHLSSKWDVTTVRAEQ